MTEAPIPFWKQLADAAVEGIKPRSALSPAAQAVLDAVFPVYDDEHLYVATGEQHAGMIAAAALRAAAYQVVPILDDPEFFAGNCCERNVKAEREDTRADLFAIAAELEGGND